VPTQEVFFMNAVDDALVNVISGLIVNAISGVFAVARRAMKSPSTRYEYVAASEINTRKLIIPAICATAQ
jgi:hypothetical protein